MMKTSTIVALLLTILLPCASFAGVVYVKQDSPGPVFDGKSWETAFHGVQEAMDAAQVGDEIWVAEGVYRELITQKSNTKLLGGFSGKETSKEQRDRVQNVTVLDGEQKGCVITASGDTSALIDGFTIRNGKAEYDSAGGIQCTYSSPTISNNVIANNDLYGIHCNYSAAIIMGNVFQENGAAVYFERCGQSGQLSNNVIKFNYMAVEISSCSPTVANNTIVGNSRTGGAGVRCRGAAYPQIANNIIAYNASGVYATTQLPMSNNCVYGNTAFNYSGFADPTGTDGNISLDPLFVSKEFGDFHIQPDSPCYNAGSDTAVGQNWVDIDGQLRVADGQVDIGADESDGVTRSVTPRVVRVSPDGNDNNDGSSWNSAKQTVQAAVDEAAENGGEVWVEAGEYSGSIQMKPRVYIYGGFAGSESTRQERDWQANSTTLDGAGGDHVIGVSTGHIFTAIDGFVIRNAACGIKMDSASPRIANNIITQNGASDTGISYIGSGISCGEGCPVIENNTVVQNEHAGMYLGVSEVCSVYGNPLIKGNRIQNNEEEGIWCTSGSVVITGNEIISNGSSGIYAYNTELSVAGNTIENNTYARDGGAVKATKCHVSIHNNSLRGNSVMVEGGGVYLKECTGRVDANSIENNLITMFSQTSYAGGICLRDSSVTISNNLITGNKGAYYDPTYGGGVYCLGGSPILLNNTIAANKAGNGGGICLDSTGASLVGNVIVNCSSGIYLKSGSVNASSIECNNIWNNSRYNYSGFPDPTGTNSNISLDPLFADPANGDYHLLPGSPCIDAGSAEGASEVDLDGIMRPRDGDGDGEAVADIGCYEAPANFISLTGTKGLPDGSPVGISCPVTALFGDRFYLESRNRGCGIGVLGSASATGVRVTVEGSMATVDGERVIAPSLIAETGAAAVPLPWYLNFNALGGGPTGLQAGVKDWRPVKNPETGEIERELVTYGGANNIGLLVRTTGRVTHLGADFFYLDGSCAFDDGDESIKGVRVDWPFPQAMPDEGSFVEITAISSCTVKNGEVVRMLRPVSADAVR